MKRELTIILLFAITISATAQVYVRNKPKVFVDATVLIFGKTNSKFQPQLKNSLRDNGWNVVERETAADYILKVSAEVRKYTEQIATYNTTHTYLPTTDSVVTTMYEQTSEGRSVYGNGSMVRRGNCVTTTTQVTHDYVDIKGTEPNEYMFFVYMDAHVSLSSANDVLYEDILEVKEGHTKSYEEAGFIASKEVINKLTEILPNKIKRR